MGRHRRRREQRDFVPASGWRRYNDPRRVQLHAGAASQLSRRRAERWYLARTTEQRRDMALKPVVIENVKPQVDHGRFAIKRTAGETVMVEADVFADGHDQLRCLLRHRHSASRDWTETAMTLLGNDRWHGEFMAVELGCYQYQLIGRVDTLLSWRHGFVRRNTADEDEIALSL